MRSFTINETSTGWEVVDSDTLSVLGSYASLSGLRDGLVDIIAASSGGAGSIAFGEGDV